MKPTITITKTDAPVATIRLGVEVQIPNEDGPERDQAFAALAAFLRLGLTTVEERRAFLADLQMQLEVAKRS